VGVTEKKIYVKDIKTGDKVSEIFLAGEKNLAYSQKGSPYLNIRLKDRTGDVDGKVWENALDWDKAFKRGDLIRIQARALSFKNAIQLSIIELRKVEDAEVELADYFPVAKGDRAAMFAEILAYCEQVKTPCLAALLLSFFKDEKIAALFGRAPAAKGFHHVYIGGLLEHTLSVVRLLDRAAGHYAGVNRDLLIAGGILHDIGKIYEFSFERCGDGRCEDRSDTRFPGADGYGAPPPDPQPPRCPRIWLAQASQDAGGADRSLYGRPRRQGERLPGVYPRGPRRGVGLDTLSQALRPVHLQGPKTERWRDRETGFGRLTFNASPAMMAALMKEYVFNHFKKIDHPALKDPGRRSRAPEASETGEKPQVRQLIRPRLLT
jgi:putative nucleotidyltransferase with HDIG domain